MMGSRTAGPSSLLGERPLGDADVEVDQGQEGLPFGWLALVEKASELFKAKAENSEGSLRNYYERLSGPGYWNAIGDKMAALAGVASPADIPSHLLLRALWIASSDAKVEL